MKLKMRIVTSLAVALSVTAGTCGFANASQIQPSQPTQLSWPTEAHISSDSHSVPDVNEIDTQSVEDLFTTYITLDDRNFMHLNEEAVLNSPYKENLNELLYFTGLMNEINAQNLGIKPRDGWSFAKCVIADAVGVNMVSRLTKGLYYAIRAAKWPLAARTILQIAGSAGLNLGWKANALGLAISLGKSAFYCRNKW